MSKSYAVLLLILGTTILVFSLPKELNKDFSKEWISSIMGILVAVFLFWLLIFKLKKNQKQ